jgi:hypothetical protein
MSSTNGILQLSCETFRDQLFELSEPALIYDGLRESAGIQHWTPETLRCLNTGRFVDLDVSYSGVWMFRPEANPKQQYTIKDVPFERACDLIENAGPEGPKYYVPHLSICEKVPGLQNDLGFPFSLNPSRSYLWFGSAGTVTRLHCDIENNLFGQIFGRKKVTLFSPEESSFVYQFPVTSPTAHFSFIDVEKPDLARYPLYSKAQSKTVTVLPGQLLFIPAGWWHHVRSLEVSISVTEWLKPTLLKRAVPSLLWFLIWEFKRDRWTDLLEREQVSVVALLDIAEKLVQFNPCAATLAAAAALENTEIPQNADAEIGSEVLNLGRMLGELVSSMVRTVPAPVSSELVVELTKRIRLVLDAIEHSTLNKGRS